MPSLRVLSEHQIVRSWPTAGIHTRSYIFLDSASLQTWFYIIQRLYISDIVKSAKTPLQISEMNQLQVDDLAAESENVDMKMLFRPSLQTEYICSCFFKRNIFINKYKMHVVFENQAQFEEEYRQLLHMKGCATENQYAEVLHQIEAEVGRRKSFHEVSHSNHEYNQLNYPKLHPPLWTFQSSFLDKRFITIVEDAKAEPENALLMSLVQNGGNITESKVYRFPVFTKEFCSQLVEEIKNFEKFPGPKSRPNTMNSYGTSLDEMGISESLLMPLIRDHLQPITMKLFSQWGGGSIDSFKAFIVNYSEDGDKDLSLHYDNAEITINISLNDEFEGGLLQFGGMWGEEGVQKQTLSSHEVGHGILHCGRHMHSALPITSGQRSNLIIWMRSSIVRNMMCPMCGQPPTLVEVPFAGEGFMPQTRSCNCS